MMNRFEFLVFMALMMTVACSSDDNTPTDKSRTTALQGQGCPSPLLRVDEEAMCLQDDAVCFRMKEGEEVFFCTGEAPVDPECRDELIRVETEGGCLQDDAFCEEITKYGETYFCTGGAPRCGPGFHVNDTDMFMSEEDCEPDDEPCVDGLERVETESGCLQDDAICLLVQSDDGDYYCTGEAI